MKKQILNTLAAVALIAGVVSCKGEKNETEAKDAQEVAVVEDATKFKVDAAGSTIAWVGSKPTGKHNGTINIENGVVNVAGDVITGTFLIDMTSITVTDLEAGDGKESLEGHLKGMAEGKEDHFFNVAKYPTAAFEVTGVTEKDGKKMMQGNLTMRDQKKNIEFPVSYTVEGENMTLTSEPFTIDRTDWGVNYGSQSVFDDLGDKFISDDIELTVNLKATKA
ncbi:polyisoprenoid-binding protein YceI [Dokdonia sp. Hel_I_63]|uniref:YceI family protein n=1 Tax=unclassified Dokdonia TaxID=2615033 RepID=UPI00020A62CD|nr:MULTISPECIES: YceI family protein [unclassified Dokdonia]AEE19998.1 YceI family protein [Dokdonia sp. 4H-3-7-5]TVZ23748.1 polyisoprenoid-binding protein YceI [Dokdonia sp. Hel_I_63]